MRKSCFMKVKLTLEESIQPNDAEIIKNELHFIIDNGECHYFNNKTLDFIPDTTGFKQFEDYIRKESDFHWKSGSFFIKCISKSN